MTNPVNPPQWISVDERYPEIGQDVVYFFDVCGMYVGKYLGEHCFGGECGFLTDDVTHWMPYKVSKRKREIVRYDWRDYTMEVSADGEFVLYEAVKHLLHPEPTALQPDTYHVGGEKMECWDCPATFAFSQNRPAAPTAERCSICGSTAGPTSSHPHLPGYK